METNYRIINFTTGPVMIPDEVKKTFSELPESHRTQQFSNSFAELQNKLCAFTKAKYVNFFTGSGTLANEVMIAQIKRNNAKGIVLSNGEFGNRLINQCKRQGIDFISYNKDWGSEFELNEIEEILKNKDLNWILFVHSESSTGCINDMKNIVSLATKYQLNIYVDTVSSISNQEINLNEVTIATASSGKGLASIPGIALVFSNERIEPDDNIPTYLDLGYYFQKDGIPFTISSNLIFALNEATNFTTTSSHLKNISELSSYLIQKLKAFANIEILNTKYALQSHIITIKPMHGLLSTALGNALMKKNIDTSFNSKYLVERNFLQIAIMSQHSKDEIDLLVENLGEQLYHCQVETPDSTVSSN